MDMPLDGPTLLPESGHDVDRLVILLHGYGADGEDLIGLAPELRRILPTAAYHAPNAPFPCEMAPWGRQWFSLAMYDPEMLRRDPATMAPVLQAMREGADRAAPALTAYIDALLAHYRLRDDRLALVGFSQGTMMALHVGLRRPTPVAGIVGFSGALLGRDTLAHEITCRPPIRLIHGNADPVVPVQASQLAAQTLTALSVEVDLHLRPGLAHGIDGEGLALAAAFLNTRLSG